MFAYMIMIGSASATGTSLRAPGTSRVAGITIAAILIVIMTLRMPPRAAEGGDPQQ
jgi:hypothetical protein